MRSLSLTLLGIHNDNGLLEPAVASVSYAFTSSHTWNWNMVAGAQFMLNKKWDLPLEAGFLGRTSFMANLNYRFGLKCNKKVAISATSSY